MIPQTEDSVNHLSYQTRRRLKNGQALITEPEVGKLQERVAAFLRRVAKPKQGRIYRHPERLELIEYLLALKTNRLAVDVMHACLRSDIESLERARQALMGDAPKVTPQKADPLPEPEQSEVDSFIARLTKTADPFRDNWSDENGCYVIGITDGKPGIGIAADDWMHAKYKTPEPGDLVILPCDKNSNKLLAGHFVSSHDDRIKIHLENSVREFICGQPPLVVTKITKGDDDE